MTVRVHISPRELGVAEPAIVVATDSGPVGGMATQVDIVCECGKVPARVVQDKGKAHVIADGAERVRVTSRETPWRK